MIDPSDRATWPEADRANQQPVIEQCTFDPWHNFTLMLVLCGLLAFDWLLRLVRGYV